MNDLSDILSFYKEEVAGETGGVVHMLAECRASTKFKALEQLVDECVEAHERALRIFKHDKDAYNAYMSFAQGYVDFHFVPGRYKLSDLFPC